MGRERERKRERVWRRWADGKKDGKGRDRPCETGWRWRGKVAGRRGRESGCRLVPGYGWEALGEPGGDGDGEEGSFGQGMRGARGCCLRRGEAEELFSVPTTHILHASSCPRDARPGRASPKGSGTGRKEAEAAGAAIKRCLARRRPARMATPSPASAPLRPVGHKAHGEAVLASGSRNRGCETCRERWRWGARAQSIPAPGSRPPAAVTPPLGFFLQLGHGQGPKGSSAGFKAGGELGLMSSGKEAPRVASATPCDRPFLPRPRYRHATPAASAAASIPPQNEVPAARGGGHGGYRVPSPQPRLLLGLFIARP